MTYTITAAPHRAPRWARALWIIVRAIGRGLLAYNNRVLWRLKYLKMHATLAIVVALWWFFHDVDVTTPGSVAASMTDQVAPAQPSGLGSVFTLARGILGALWAWLVSLAGN